MKDRSPRLVRVRGTSQVATLDDRSRWRPVLVVSWQSSARYCGDKSFSALYTRTAILNSMRCRTGSQWSCLNSEGTRLRITGSSCTQNFDKMSYSRAELSLLPVSENGRPLYCNCTSDFDFDLLILMGMAFCVSVPNLIQIGQRKAEL